MKTGSISLNFKAGEVVGASVGAGLQECYSRLFDAARADLELDTADVDDGVRVVVFGCMLIEAAAAEILEKLLSTSVPAAAHKAFAAAIDKSPMGYRLEAIAGFDKESEHSWVAPVRRAFTIRNKLVHFRELFVSVPAPADVHAIESWLDEIPEAELVRELRKPLIQQTATALANAKNRLDAILVQYAPTTRISFDEPNETTPR